MFKEFREFIARGNVMDMAVGIIMGAAFTAIVTSVVGDLIMPIIGVATSGVDFKDLFIALDGGTYASMKAAKDAGVSVISYGLFINAVIKFIIVAWVLFMIIKGMNSMKRTSTGWVRAKSRKAGSSSSLTPRLTVITSVVEMSNSLSRSRACWRTRWPAWTAAPTRSPPRPCWRRARSATCARSGCSGARRPGRSRATIACCSRRPRSRSPPRRRPDGRSASRPSG